MEIIQRLLEIGMQEILIAITSIVGTASILFALIQKIFNLTPNDKWDARLSAIQKALAWALAVLDRVAVNPDNKGARQCKDGICPPGMEDDDDKLTGAGA